MPLKIHQVSLERDLTSPYTDTLNDPAIIIGYLYNTTMTFSGWKEEVFSLKIFVNRILRTGYFPDISG